MIKMKSDEGAVSMELKGDLCGILADFSCCAMELTRSIAKKVGRVTAKTIVELSVNHALEVFEERDEEEEEEERGDKIDELIDMLKEFKEAVQSERCKP